MRIIHKYISSLKKVLFCFSSINSNSKKYNTEKILFSKDDFIFKCFMQSENLKKSFFSIGPSHIC